MTARAREFTSGKALLEKNLDDIRNLIDRLARRHGLRPEDTEEFGSYAFVKLIENDYRRLARYRGKSTLKTYLVVVIQRLLLDFCDHRWGKWRPSTRAARMGPEAVHLEKLMGRHGMSLSEAIETLRINHRCAASEAELRQIALRLPLRHRASFVGCELPHVLADEGTHRMERALDVDDAAGRVESAIGGALRELSLDDRRFLKEHFEDGKTIQEIARCTDGDARRLYARVPKILRRLRESLERRGIHRAHAQQALGSRAWAVDFGSSSARLRRSSRPRRLTTGT